MDVWEWGWLAGLVGVLILLEIVLVSTRRGRGGSVKREAADLHPVEESDVREALVVDVMVSVPAEAAVSLRRHLDEASGAVVVVVVDLGPRVWTIDAALLASRHRRDQEALADRLEELASIAGNRSDAVTVVVGWRSSVATALDTLRPALRQPFRPVPASRG